MSNYINDMDIDCLKVVTYRLKDDIPESLIIYLKSNKMNLLKQWKERHLISQDDLYRDTVEANGLQMFQIIIEFLCSNVSDNEIKDLAYKVAKERLEANSNIGEFVYNVNLGRSILVEFFNHASIPGVGTQTAIDSVSMLFDTFSFYAVTKYTELKNAELQEKILFINQSHKDRMTLLGQMSSSFVHEFRNPLTSVIGFLKLLKDENPDLKYMDTLENELAQLNFRITQFLHVSKLDVVEKKKELVSLHTLFDEMLKFLYPSIVDGDVLITTQIDDVSILVFKDEVKQILLNLILNSIDALKLKESQREITITCTKMVDHIKLIVSNNGPAIRPEVKKIIFEPFFTTKELGTGIGLYVCKKIVEKHHGTIMCESEQDLTSFIIKLPLLEEA